MLRSQRNVLTGEARPIEWLQLPCWTRSCPMCGPRVRRRLVGHFVGVFRNLPGLRFVTLTVDQAAALAAAVELKDSRRYLVFCWSKLRKRLRRLDPGLVFTLSFERHVSGWFHGHAIVSSVIGEEAFRSAAFAAGFGGSCDVESIDDEKDLARRVGYSVKYIMKDSKGGRYLASEGIGYHAYDQQLRREAYAQGGTIEDAETARARRGAEYFDAEGAGRRGVAALVDEHSRAAAARGGSFSANRLLPGDAKRFGRAAREGRKFVIRELRKREREMWVHQYERLPGRRLKVWYTKTVLPWDPLERVERLDDLNGGQGLQLWPLRKTKVVRRRR